MAEGQKNLNNGSGDTSSTKRPTEKRERRRCHLCDLPAVEALRLEEDMVWPVPLCRNHARRGRKVEEQIRINKRRREMERAREGTPDMTWPGTW